MSPLIGLTTYREQAAFGVWDQQADLLPTAYADAVVRARGTPLLLPPATDTAQAAAAVVAKLDGLVISGGADVDPARYGESPHERTGKPRPDRDAWEIALLEAAAGVGLPTLGICRGMQVMAVAAGGILDQHTPDLVGHTQHDPGADNFGDIDVTTEESSLLRGILGRGLVVRCHHHQSVRSHPGYRAAAWAADGTVEAMEVEGSGEGDRFCVAVQWHPEAGRDQRLFDALVEAASHR